MPERPPRLRPVFQKYHPPLYFVTFNTHDRKKLLANLDVHSRFVEFAKLAEKRGISVGCYVILPDHIHLFVRNNSELTIAQWVRLLKRHLSDAIRISRPHWQSGFFDRLIRHRESYSAKWHYVRDNPVRANLVSTPEKWPWQGEILPLQAL
jgi:putative transposase